MDPSIGVRPSSPLQPECIRMSIYCASALKPLMLCLSTEILEPVGLPSLRSSCRVPNPSPFHSFSRHAFPSSFARRLPRFRATPRGIQRLFFESTFVTCYMYVSTKMHAGDEATQLVLGSRSVNGRFLHKRWLIFGCHSANAVLNNAFALC